MTPELFCVDSALTPGAAVYCREVATHGRGSWWADTSLEGRVPAFDQAIQILATQLSTEEKVLMITSFQIEQGSLRERLL